MYPSPVLEGINALAMHCTGVQNRIQQGKEKLHYSLNQRPPRAPDFAQRDRAAHWLAGTMGVPGAMHAGPQTTSLQFLLLRQKPSSDHDAFLLAVFDELANDCSTFQVLSKPCFEVDSLLQTHRAAKKTKNNSKAEGTLARHCGRKGSYETRGKAASVHSSL